MPAPCRISSCGASSPAAGNGARGAGRGEAACSMAPAMPSFMSAKIQTARFYADCLLPRARPRAHDHRGRRIRARGRCRAVLTAPRGASGVSGAPPVPSLDSYLQTVPGATKISRVIAFVCVTGAIMSDELHRVGERRGVAVGERERRDADLGGRDLRRIERHGAERRSDRLEEIAGEHARPRLVGGHDEPQRRVVVIVSEPGGEDRVALVIEVDPPSGLGCGRRFPPQVLVVGGEREIRLRAKDARRQRSEHLADQCLGLGHTAALVDGVIEAAVVGVTECQRASADRRGYDVGGIPRDGVERGACRLEQLALVHVGPILLAVITSHQPLPCGS